MDFLNNKANFKKEFLDKNEGWNIDRNVNHIHLILHNLQSVFCKVICKKLLFGGSYFSKI